MWAGSGSGSVTVEQWIRRSLWLVACTMVYNALEAVVALWAGVGAGSIALVGFGLDSVIELAAATVVLWRIAIEVRGTDSQRVTRAEIRALLEQMRGMDPQELEDGVFKEFRFDLCMACQRRFLRDPLGREARARVVEERR